MSSIMRWRSGLTVSVIIGKLLSGVRLQTPRSSRQGAPPATAVLSPPSRLSPREAGYREAISCIGPERRFAAAQEDARNWGKTRHSVDATGMTAHDQVL